MTSASSLAQFTGGQRDGNILETVEIDPQFASALGFSQGETVISLESTSTTVLTIFGI